MYTCHKSVDQFGRLCFHVSFIDTVNSEMCMRTSFTLIFANLLNGKKKKKEVLLCVIQ